jgi:hypothetical protein
MRWKSVFYHDLQFNAFLRRILHIIRSHALRKLNVMAMDYWKSSISKLILYKRKLFIKRNKISLTFTTFFVTKRTERWFCTEYSRFDSDCKVSNLTEGSLSESNHYKLQQWKENRELTLNLFVNNNISILFYTTFRNTKMSLKHK